eukprot:NODE_1864_length_1046_cov_346.318870.p2 GENE.NODE_1864_length_1046_cov_346.318870~~NODE_1864_length_1046_cov_346.318870.p2  ORF type:complete len:139 (+),score=43.38 NODE_1864_length_1046_cov_346.318870:361-777(+)
MARRDGRGPMNVEFCIRTTPAEEMLKALQQISIVLGRWLLPTMPMILTLGSLTDCFFSGILYFAPIIMADSLGEFGWNPAVTLFGGSVLEFFGILGLGIGFNLYLPRRRGLICSCLLAAGAAAVFGGSLGRFILFAEY